MLRHLAPEPKKIVNCLNLTNAGVDFLRGFFSLPNDGTMAEYVAVEARNVAPLPGDVDFTVGASLPISGGLVAGTVRARPLQAGQSVLVHDAAGAVGSMMTQLAREAGAYVIGTGRAADRQTALDFGAQEFVDLDNESLEDVVEVDLVFDVIGGDIGKRSAGLLRAGGALVVSIVGPTEAQPPAAWRSTLLSCPIAPNWVRSSSGCATDDFGRTSTSRPSTMRSPPSTGPSGARGRRSSAFVRERHAYRMHAIAHVRNRARNRSSTADRSGFLLHRLPPKPARQTKLIRSMWGIPDRKIASFSEAWFSGNS